MNILNLLIKDKRVVGVEINDTFIRIAYFRPKNKFSKKISSGKTEILENKLVLIEEPISLKVISDGVVIDKESLGKILKNIWTKEKLTGYYAIVSIPSDKIYSHTFLFPKTVTPEKLRDATNLAIDFQLPLKKSEAYIGSEKIADSHTSSKVLVSAIPKNIASDYILALHYAGIKTLALESHIASIARSIKLTPNVLTLINKKNSDGTNVFILKDNNLVFSRILPKVFIKKDSEATKEIKKIKDSFESEKTISVTELPFKQATIQDEYTKYPEFKKLDIKSQSDWLVALGAAIRGKIPKGQDEHISLLPIGTAEAYAYQKKATFIRLIRNIIISTSLFFLLAFLAAYLFILYLSQESNSTNSNISISPISPDVIKTEEQIKHINGMTHASNSILSTTPKWSIILDDINSRVIPGIVISRFSATSITDRMSIVGVALDRDTLNKFKKSLQESTYITLIELPITNLEQKGDIPFSVSFSLKDPSALYYK